MVKRTLGAARSHNTFGIFEDHETDWLFKRTLEYMSEKAAEIGECLHTASKINGRDVESWIKEWAELAGKVDAQGDESLLKGQNTSARESFLRASNYYRTAEYACAPSHPLFHELWEKSVKSMHKACPLFNPPIQKIEVPFEDKKLPGYYWRPDESSTKRPTLIMVGGNDSSGEEILLVGGAAAIKRGYNFFTFEYPGHRGTVHLYPDCVKRPDYEVPFKAAIDYLETLPGVDERIVLAGFSFGGYVASRVAIHEKRLKAVIPDSPIIDAGEMLNNFWGSFPNILKPLLDTLINWRLRNSPITKNFMRYSLWTWGYHDISLIEWSKLGLPKTCNIRDNMHKITCPALALVGEGEGEVMIKQAQEFYDGISSTKKELHIFTLDEDGSNDHCQLDNITRGHQVIFDWLDEVFNYKDNVLRSVI